MIERGSPAGLDDHHPEDFGRSEAGDPSKNQDRPLRRVIDRPGADHSTGLGSPNVITRGRWGPATHWRSAPRPLGSAAPLAELGFRRLWRSPRLLASAPPVSRSRG